MSLDDDSYPMDRDFFQLLGQINAGFVIQLVQQASRR